MKPIQINLKPNKEMATAAMKRKMEMPQSTPALSNTVSKERLNAIHDAFDRAEAPKPEKLSPQNAAYKSNMEAAYKKAEKAGQLGEGFGGEKEEVKPRPAPEVMKVGRRIIK